MKAVLMKSRLEMKNESESSNMLRKRSMKETKREWVTSIRVYKPKERVSVLWYLYCEEWTRNVDDDGDQSSKVEREERVKTIADWINRAVKEDEIVWQRIRSKREQEREVEENDRRVDDDLEPSRLESRSDPRGRVKGPKDRWKMDAKRY